MGVLAFRTMYSSGGLENLLDNNQVIMGGTSILLTHVVHLSRCYSETFSTF